MEIVHNSKYYITRMDEKKQSFPYYDETENIIKYHPSMINFKTGLKEWSKNGKIHSYNDAPALIFKDGTKKWCKDNRLYKLTVIHPTYYPENEEYYIEGKCYHRNYDDERQS